MAVAVVKFWHYGLHSAIPADFPVPIWIKIVAATAMGCGTAISCGSATGGRRVLKTMGHQLAKIGPIHGLAAETGAATVIEVASYLGHHPALHPALHPSSIQLFRVPALRVVPVRCAGILLAEF